ncbi:GIY-YIG nuclease family protein [Streptomyces pseudogriseolus]|uniref:GIY-YIG nuclease family protein n=1 Tax=Streptomyces pseudogriseolus TaxID=36817 RepID=UPI003653F465
MLRASDGGPVQMYQDPEDPIISFSSPIAGWLYERHPDIPNYWVAVGQKPNPAPQPKGKTTPRKRRSRASEGDDSIRTALYRLRDGDGALLYVGISSKPPQRWGQHAADKEWWLDVATLSMEWFESRTDALEAEAEAIRAEQPRHNIQHNKVAA